MTKPVTSAAKRLRAAPVSLTLTPAQTLDIVMLLKEHARMTTQRVKKNHMRLSASRQSTINRMKSHLVGIDERECSLAVWNAVCDALGEIDDDR